MWTPTHVQVTVYRAKNLLHKGKGDTNDAYVTIKLGEEKYQTSIKERSREPEWMEECDLPLEDRSGCVILNTYHRNLLGIDEFLGHVTIGLDQFQVHEKPRSKWYALKNKTTSKKPEKYRGEIEVKITFIVQSLTGSHLALNKTGRVKRSNSIKSFAHSVGEKMQVKWPRRESLSNKSLEYSPNHSPHLKHHGPDGDDSPTVQVMSRHDISRGHDILPTSFNNYSDFKRSRTKKSAVEDEDMGSDPSSINKKRPSSAKKEKVKTLDDAEHPRLQKAVFAKSMFDLSTTSIDDLTDHHAAPSSDCEEDYETYSLSSSEGAPPGHFDKPGSPSLQSITESESSSSQSEPSSSPIQQRETPEGKEKLPALHEGQLSPKSDSLPHTQRSPQSRRLIRSSSSSANVGKVTAEEEEDDDRASPSERGKRMKDVSRLGVGSAGTLRRAPRVSTHELHEGILEYKRAQDQRASCELPEHVLQQFAGYEREDLIRMVLEQRVSMQRKDQSCRDMENYIDNLLVKVMEETPKLLQSHRSPPKPRHMYTTFTSHTAVSNNRTATGRLQGSGQPLKSGISPTAVSYHSGGTVSISSNQPRNGSTSANSHRSPGNSNNSNGTSPNKRNSGGKNFNNPFKKILK